MYKLWYTVKMIMMLEVKQSHVKQDHHVEYTNTKDITYPVSSIFSIDPMHLNLPLKSSSFSARRHHSDSNLTPGLAVLISLSCSNVSFDKTNIIGIEYVSPSVFLANILGSSPGSQVFIMSIGYWGFILVLVVMNRYSNQRKNSMPVVAGLVFINRLISR